jgi:hypothetical protein
VIETDHGELKRLVKNLAKLGLFLHKYLSKSLKILLVKITGEVSCYEEVLTTMDISAANCLGRIFDPSFCAVCCKKFFV